MASLKTLVLDPQLPAWLPDIVLRDLRVGDAKATLRFWRREKCDSTWDVLEQEGSLHLVRQPPLESLSAGWTDRASAVLESLVK